MILMYRPVSQAFCVIASSHMLESASEATGMNRIKIVQKYIHSFKVINIHMYVGIRIILSLKVNTVSKYIMYY